MPLTPRKKATTSPSLSAEPRGSYQRGGTFNQITLNISNNPIDPVEYSTLGDNQVLTLYFDGFLANTRKMFLFLHAPKSKLHRLRELSPNLVMQESLSQIFELLAPKQAHKVHQSPSLFFPK